MNIFKMTKNLHFFFRNKSVKSTILLIFLFCSYNFVSQVHFEKGYFINNYNETIDCYIKNLDWLNNPTSFEYKLTENGEKKEGSIKSVIEFGIKNELKYILSHIEIDRSSDNLNSLSKTKEPIFKKEAIFLKVLIEGNANLYLYKDQRLTRFFYSTKTNSIKQLIYKPYISTITNIKYNNTFKKQLWNSLKCNSITIKKLNHISYKQKELKELFIDYNLCKNGSFLNYEAKKEKQDFFKLSTKVKVNSNSLQIKTSGSDINNIYFDDFISYSFGLETEFILPFNKNKWSIFFEPTFINFSATGKRGLVNLDLNYTALELPSGVRHYLFLNDDSKLFLNAAVHFDFSFNSDIKRSESSTTFLDVKPSHYYSLGAGYKFQDTFSLEIRYQTNKPILTDYVFYYSDYSIVSLILGYTIF